MTEQLAIFDPSGRPKISTRRSNLAAVAAYFRAHQGQWVSALEIAKVGGLLSSRTRVSECRTVLGMDVENRTERQPDGSTRSFYRFKGPR